MQKLTSRAFAQAYGREHGEINLRDEELHRAKFKMAHIVAYVPEDMPLLESQEAVLQFEDALSKGLMRGIGDHRTDSPSSDDLPRAHGQEGHSYHRCSFHGSRQGHL